MNQRSEVGRNGGRPPIEIIDDDEAMGDIFFIFYFYENKVVHSRLPFESVIALKITASCSLR